MGNPFLNRIKNSGLVSHGKKSEQRVAKTMGARLHPNSGAMRGAKSDASLGNFRLEMKSTTGQVLHLDMAWLSKIASEAVSKGQLPGVTLSFVDADGKSRFKHHGEWVAIPMGVFRELVDK